MALPPQAIEKLIRDPAETPGAYRQFLMLGGTLFFLMLILYFGLVYGYEPYLSSYVVKVEEEIEKFAAEIPVEEQQKIILFYSELVNLRTLLGSRVFASPALALLERNTLPAVYYSKASLNAVTNEVSLTGVAQTLEDASREAAAFEREPSVERI